MVKVRSEFKILREQQKQFELLKYQHEHEIGERGAKSAYGRLYRQGVPEGVLKVVVSNAPNELQVIGMNPT